MYASHFCCLVGILQKKPLLAFELLPPGHISPWACYSAIYFLVVRKAKQYSTRQIITALSSHLSVHLWIFLEVLKYCCWVQTKLYAPLPLKISGLSLPNSPWPSGLNMCEKQNSFAAITKHLSAKIFARKWDNTPKREILRTFTGRFPLNEHSTGAFAF